VDAGSHDPLPLLDPVSEASPCGEDLEYDARFISLEEAAEGKPEHQIGDVVEPGVPPDWKTVERMATELLGDTKDLRIAVRLAMAWTHLRGLPGLVDGLHTVLGLVERYWDCVHPQLDPEEDNDPTIRMNALAGLADPGAMLPAVLDAPLLCTQGLGCFTLRDWETAVGTRPWETEDGREPPSLDWIGAIVRGAEVAAYEQAVAAPSQAIEALSRLREQLQGKVEDAALLPDFERLLTQLGEIRRLFRELPPPDALGSTSGATVEPETAGTAPTTAEAARSLVEIRDTRDVVTVLDAICDYYERTEPSSPIPILMQRAKRLVGRDFMDIIRNVAPDAVRQVEELRGPEEDQ